LCAGSGARRYLPQCCVGLLHNMHLPQVWHEMDSKKAMNVVVPEGDAEKMRITLGCSSVPG